MERKTPAACEQEKAEKLVSVCREILLNARNELYLNLRFMDAALSSLNFVPDFTAEGAGTDGYHYTYQPDFLGRQVYVRPRPCEPAVLSLGPALCICPYGYKRQEGRRTVESGM